MTQKAMSRFCAWLFLSVLTTSIASGHTIERSEKYTIVKFNATDFCNVQIAEDSGWNLGCVLTTKPFNVPGSYAAEVEVLIIFSATWEKTFQSAEKLAAHRLASFELSYVDALGSQHFEPKMLRPSDLGPIYLFAETCDKRSAMYGGSLDEKKTIALGPITVPAGATNVIASICDIAPETAIHMHEIQIRMRPFN